MNAGRVLVGAAAIRFLFGSGVFAVVVLVPISTALSLPADCANDTWTPTSTSKASPARREHTAVWTGKEMIVWGGFASSSGPLNTGARYNPTTDTWTAMSATNAPIGRYGHTAIWTGGEMIVWGGYDGNVYLNDGARYNPVTDTWAAISITNAPTGRYGHTAIWSGIEMIVWGGNNNNFLGTGGRYNPTTDTWVSTSISNAPIARNAHTGVWTGSEMIVWGGFGIGNSGLLNTGAKYDPSTDNWTATSTTNAPVGRQYHTGVWAGSEMIVWGGYDGSGGVGGANTGGKYNPSTDSWTATNTALAPAARLRHTAIWSGNEMVVWGGVDNNNSPTNTGGKYNPSSNSWMATSTTSAPVSRYLHTAVWSGSEMIVWGGYNGAYFDDGGRYCAQPPGAPVPQSVFSRKSHGAFGYFDIDLPLTGPPGVECRTGGATGDHTIIVAFSQNVTVNGSPQAAITSGTGTVGTDGKSNGGSVFINGNVVTVPLTNVTNNQTINVTLFGVNSTSNVVIPMSILAGDVTGNGIVNASDVAFTKSRIGQPISQTNFRADVTAGGSINATDVSIVKSNIGTGLP